MEARYLYAKYQWHIWTLFWKLLGYGKHPEQSDASSPGRYVLKIHFFIELGLKMIQIKIQFKTKSEIFIQKNIHSIESRIFNKIIHSQKMRKIIQNSKIRPKYGFGALLRPLYR